jgi:hypothetical protein
MPIKSRLSPTVMTMAASQFTLPGARTGDSGIQRHVQTAATRVTTGGGGISDGGLQPATPVKIMMPISIEVRPRIGSILVNLLIFI